MSNLKYVSVAVFIVICALSNNLKAQVIEWKTFTSVGTINDIAVDDTQLWAASNGGVLQFSASIENISESTALTKFTNTEGLSGNDIVAVEIDKKNNSVWVALSNGDLNRYLSDENRWELIDDYKGQEIQDFVIFGDSIYVALDIGVSLYLIDKEEVKETYRNMGLSVDNSVIQVAANHIFIDGTDIWVSTDKGLAQSSLLLANLQAPASWQAFTRSDGLPNDFVNQLVVFENIPYAATRSGVVRYVNGIWEPAGLTGDVIELDLVSANSFFPTATLVAFRSDGVHWYEQVTNSWSLLGGQLSNVTTLSTAREGNVWIGRENVGLGKYKFDSGTWEFVPNNGPARSNFESLALDSKGRLWSASIGGGIQMLENDVWTNFSTQNGLPSNDFRTIVVDAQDKIWAGSWGGGLVSLEETGNDFTITRFDTANNILAGFIADPGFVLVPSIFTDRDNNLWILNRQAVNTRVVAVHTAENNFLYFSTTQGIRSQFLKTGIVDQAGRVWLGTEDRGVNVLVLNETLNDPSDDDYAQGLTAGGGELFSNNITSIAEDQDGTIWIGTDAGLNFWFAGTSGEEFDTPVNVVGVDGVDNKWIGTNNGITILRGHFDPLGDITTGNSQLVADKVSAFAFDFKTGIVWIGTDRGLSRGKTLFTAPKDDLKLLSGYPNPYIIDRTGRRFTITNLVSAIRVKIFDSSGRLVRELDNELEIVGAQAFWDGTNKNGDIVASGIYVYLAYTDNNISGTGKIAVVRR